MSVFPLNCISGYSRPYADPIIDSKNDTTLLPLTPRLLPILAEVLADEPEDQLPNDETKDKIIQLVKYVASKGQQGKAEVMKYEVLAALL